MQARDGTSRDISVEWEQHHQGDPTSQCQPATTGEALLYFDHVHLQEVRPTPKGWKMLEGFGMPEMDWHL